MLENRDNHCVQFAVHSIEWTTRMPKARYNILFLLNRNSAQSTFAEAVANRLRVVILLASERG